MGGRGARIKSDESSSAHKKKWMSLKTALLTSNKKLKEWWNITCKKLIKRGIKDIRKLKDKPAKPTPWEIIKALA